MKIVLGVPVIDQHHYLEQFVKVLVATIAERDQFTLAVIDNGSKAPYLQPTGTLPFTIKIIRNKTNLGYYYPLKQLYDKFPDADVYVLMHNDAHIYEPGWDNLLRKAFTQHKQLGLVGLYGARGVDKKLWDTDAVSHFSDPTMYKPFKTTQVTALTPVLVVDSLFMAVPRTLVPLLKIDKSIALCHFYDKIWPLRLLEHGYNSAVLGAVMMHKSNVTSTMDDYYKSAQAWWKKQGVSINVESADFLMRFAGMMRYKIEFQEMKQLIPAKIDKEWNITKL